MDKIRPTGKMAANTEEHRETPIRINATLATISHFTKALSLHDTDLIQTPGNADEYRQNVARLSQELNAAGIKPRDIGQLNLLLLDLKRKIGSAENITKEMDPLTDDKAPTREIIND